MKSEFSCYPGKSWKNVSCEVPRLCVRAHGARTGAGVCLGGEGTPTKNGSSPLSTASYLSTSHSLPAPRRPFKPWEARAATIQPRVCGVDTFAPTGKGGERSFSPQNQAGQTGLSVFREESHPESKAWRPDRCVIVREGNAPAASWSALRRGSPALTAALCAQPTFKERLWRAAVTSGDRAVQ